jgi:hypothetical protein
MNVTAVVEMKVGLRHEESQIVSARQRVPNVAPISRRNYGWKTGAQRQPALPA